MGEGMHSEVYKCFRIDDPMEQYPMAVKVTREDDEEKIIALKKEYDLMKDLNHPCIVKSHEFFEN